MNNEVVVKSLFESNGFTKEHQGGGCEWYVKSIEYQGEEAFIAITCQDDPSVPVSVREPITVGIYTEGGNMKGFGMQNFLSAASYFATRICDRCEEALSPLAVDHTCEKLTKEEMAHEDWLMIDMGDGEYSVATREAFDKGYSDRIAQRVSREHALLITYAPEMLATLKAIIDINKEQGDLRHLNFDKIEALINECEAP